MTGAGIALVYPVLLAAVGDVAHPKWRGTALGAYRLWRDSGYGFAAVFIGLVSDFQGFDMGFYAVAVLMVLSGLIVAVKMYETNPKLKGH